VKLIFACGGGESFKYAFIVTLFSTAVQDVERLKKFSTVVQDEERLKKFSTAVLDVERLKKFSTACKMWKC